MLVTTQKPDKTAFGMNGRSKLGFDVPIRALDLTLPEVRHLPNVGLGEPGGVSPPFVGVSPLGRKRGLLPPCLETSHFEPCEAELFVVGAGTTLSPR